ncbi:MAG: Rpn family recombination-promoting nuclease/putative transposase, partial [Odoribacter sp.]|nr:Rpn family recombination-promoting nuclease/putative transposase [Odoribacter sp.]
LLANPEVKKAITALEESAFTDAQLLGYEKFWDIISVEKTLYGSAERRGLKKGLEQGIQQGIEQGKLEVARTMKSNGMSVEMVAKYTGLSLEDVRSL